MLFASKIVVLLVQALALVQASLLTRGEHSPKNDIESLCSGKDINLTLLSELVELGNAASKSSCPEMVKRAISDLVELTHTSNLCSANSIEQLRLYYLSYLDTSAHAKTQASTSYKLPKPLKRFALAYALQVSNRCKSNMIKVLTEEGSKNQLLSEEDFKIFGQLISDNSPVVEALSMISNPGDIVVPGDLAPLFKKKIRSEVEGLEEEKLFVQTRANAFIKKLQVICERRFRPIYEPLMLPLVKLANIGFNYKDEPLRCNLKCPRTLKQVGQWSTIVFMCETLSHIEMIEDPEQANESGNKLVRILTKKEATSIGATNKPTENLKEDDEFKVARVSYEPKAVTLETDMILDKSDKKLVNAIKSIKTNRDEADIIRKRIVNKSLSFLKQELKRGHVGLILSAAWKGLLKKNNQSASTSVQIVKTLNDMMEHQEANGQLDGPISVRDYDITEDWGTQLFLVALFVVFVAGCVLGSLALGGVIG